MNVKEAYSKSQVCIYTTLAAHHARAYPGYLPIKRTGILLLPLDEMLANGRVHPSIKFAGTIYTPERREALC